MIRSLAARCRLRAVGTVVGLVTTVGIGGIAGWLSDTGWHVVALSALLVLAAASAVALLVGHLRLSTGSGPLARGLLERGLLGAVVAVVGLVVVGALGLLVATDPGATAVTTWLTALPASGVVLLGAQGRAEARQPTWASARPGPTRGRPHR